MTYRAVKHRVICWTRAILFELAAIQIAVGVVLWALAWVFKTDDTPVVLAMSALALVFSGFATAAVAAIDEGNTTEGTDP